MRAWSMMYKAVVQTVLLYRREIWVLTETILKILEGFHHCVAQRTAGMSHRRVGGGMGVLIYGGGLGGGGDVEN